MAYQPLFIINYNALSDPMVATTSTATSLEKSEVKQVHCFKCLFFHPAILVIKLELKSRAVTDTSTHSQRRTFVWRTEQMAYLFKT